MIDRIVRTLRRPFDWILDERPEWVLRLYPPYLGAGIRVEHVSDDFRRVEVRMPLSWYNQNYVGTQFGGSLYSMCDPFYMLMLMNNLGEEYVVWDKAAEIRFRQPGTGPVGATFEIDGDDLSRIRGEVEEQGVCEPEFEVDVVEESGEVVAEVVKTLHVRREE